MTSPMLAGQQLLIFQDKQFYGLRTAPRDHKHPQHHEDPTVPPSCAKATRPATTFPSGSSYHPV